MRSAMRLAFALRDLVTALVLVFVIAAIVLALAAKSDDEKNRVQCADNLRRIGQALQQYANDNKGQLPRVRYDMAAADEVKMFTNPTATDPFAAGGPEINDVSAGLFLLIRSQKLDPAIFVCPSTDARPMWGDRDKPAKMPANFSSVSQLSYSYLNPYPGERGVGAGFKPMLSSSLVMAADLNPGGETVSTIKFEQMPPPPLQPKMEYAASAPDETKFTASQRAANSPNHRGFGQNVLDTALSVSWQPTPFVGTRVGPGSDNIYTRDLKDIEPTKRGDPVVGPPMGISDTVLLPIAQPIGRVK